MSDPNPFEALTLAIGQAMGEVLRPIAQGVAQLLRSLRARPRRSRQLRSPRRRQELRQWARLTGGRLAVKPGALARLPIAGLDLRRGAPASLGPATVADAQAFTTWLATRRRWGLVPDAVPMREQPSEVLGPFPTPERPRSSGSVILGQPLTPQEPAWEPSVMERVYPQLQALHEQDSYAKAIALGDPSQAPEWTPEACSGEPGCRCRACWQIGET